MKAAWDFLETNQTKIEFVKEAAVKLFWLKEAASFFWLSIGSAVPVHINI